MPLEDKLETRLIREQWVNPAHFIKAKDEQTKVGKSVYATLIKMGYMSEEKMYAFFSQQALIPFVRIADYKPNAEVLKLFPEASCREYCFLPLVKVDTTLYVCMANPLDTNLITTLERQSGLEVFPLFALPAQVLQAVDRYFGPDDRWFNLDDLITFPQTIGVMPFWRESDRLVIKIEAEFMVDDERMQFVSSVFVPATVTDISSSGKALGFKTMVFVPPTIKLALRFPTYQTDGNVTAEVVRCNLDKGGSYLMGVKLLTIGDALLASLLKEASKP